VVLRAALHPPLALAACPRGPPPVCARYIFRHQKLGRKATHAWTLRTSLIVCFSATKRWTGAGLLALPYGFAEAGWSVSILMLVVSGLASVFTMHLLTLCGRKV
jgi:hypothetical protein